MIPTPSFPISSLGSMKIPSLWVLDPFFTLSKLSHGTDCLFPSNDFLYRIKVRFKNLIFTRGRPRTKRCSRTPQHTWSSISLKGHMSLHRSSTSTGPPKIKFQSLTRLLSDSRVSTHLNSARLTSAPLLSLLPSVERRLALPSLHKGQSPPGCSSVCGPRW